MFFVLEFYSSLRVMAFIIGVTSNYTQRDITIENHKTKYKLWTGHGTVPTSQAPSLPG